MNNVMSVWKQWQHEGSAPEETNPSSSDMTVDGNANSAIGRGLAPARVFQTASTPRKTAAGRGMSTLGRGGGNPFSGNYHPSEGAGRARPLTQSSGRGVSVFGVSSSASPSGGRGSGRGRGTDSTMASVGASESPVVVTPFKTDASALGAFLNASTTTTATRRRFTETPQSGYRDRAAERRSLYASSLPGDVSEVDGKDKGIGKDMPFPPGVGARGVGRGSDMPFPSGVGGGGSKQGTEASGAVMGGADSESFEVITAEKALDANNVGNRMLRNKRVRYVKYL